MVQTKIVSKIKQTHYTPHQRGAHMSANYAEKRMFGARRFNELNRIMQEKLSAHEMAGSHVGGDIRISKKIPQRFRKEIKFHELYEMKKVK